MKTKITICALLCLLTIVSAAWSKRGRAPVVGPLIYENLKYIAPNDDGVREYIEVWDLQAKKKVWEQTIYTNSIQPGLEKDVQWVFIKKITIDRGNLLITDEHDRRFLLDLKTRRIKRLQ